MKTLRILFLLILCGLLFNCSSSSNDDDYNTPDPDPTPTPDPDPTPMDEVTYDADIKSIISNNCLQCHGSPTTNNAPMSLTTYAQVKNNVDNIISRINSSTNPMPPSPNSPLSASEKSLIQQWKDDGLLEN
ncbi:hypothetical protein [Flavisericum labens]|uniref:hypothetical protein n=1 Tax=Flavisericum labens TaxID=3377112 RepID=UPI00387B5CAC